MRAWPLLLALLGPTAGDAPAKSDPPAPPAADSAKEARPDYRLKPGEFPPIGTGRVVDGALVEADFIHRSGQFRRADDGTLVDFTMPPFGTVLYLDAEADLRDVPLGTLLHFSTYPGEPGAPTRVASIRDDFTALARDGVAYRIDEVRAGDGKLVVSAQATSGGRPKAAPRELRLDDRTRIWKGDGAAKREDLAVGDALLVNLDGAGRCTEAWAGDQARKLATGRQQARHRAFIKQRGIPAWIDRVEGKRLHVTLLGDPDGLRILMAAERIEPARWASERRSVDAVVANEELRTHNPPVDRKRARVLAYEALPPGRHGCGGVRWVIEPDLLLEGFRKGEVIRLFAHPSWPVNDMPFGECLYSEAPDARPDRIDPNLYPYRTDSGNADLPWFRPKPGEFPPFHSHHEVVGELVRVDDGGRSGRFRADRTGEPVDFTMPPYGAAVYLDAEADLADIPLGTRCRFFLHQDERGSFTRATVISDEFTRMADGRLTFRLDSARLDEGTILLAVQHAPVKDEKEAMIRPPDFGRGEFAVDHRTRVWKGGGPATLRDLVPGDELLLNTTGRTTTSRGVCTEIWAGAEASKSATDRRRSARRAVLREQGFPAWVDRVEGKTIAVTFFAYRPREFRSLLGGDPGGAVYALPADDGLRPADGPAVRLAFRGHMPRAEFPGTYGNSGVSWLLEPAGVPEGFRPGRPLRIFKEDPRAAKK